MKKITLLLAAMLPWCAWAAGEPADYNETTKTVTILSPSDLTWLATQVNAETPKTFEGWTITLGEDLDMTDVSYTPIGNASTKKFCGTFDGNGKTISNLTYNSASSSYVGLFGNVGATGLIKDLTIDACSFKGKSFIGGFAGKNEGIIQNCMNSGTSIDAGNSGFHCGGVVGYNSGTVSGCTNYSNVSTKNKVGGIVGSQFDNGTISYCRNYGNVTSIEGYAGGIVGNADNGDVSYSFNSGDVKATNVESASYLNYTGAVIGMRKSTITECYYDSKVTVAISYIKNNKTVTNEYTYETSGGCGIGGKTPQDTEDSYTVYCSISLSATEVSGVYWTTYFNGVCSMKVADNTTTTVYAATRNGETLTLKEVTDGIINKGQGVILKSTAASIAMTSTGDVSTGNAYTDNVLSGVDEATEQASGTTYYVLSTGSTNETVNGLGFYKYSSGNTLAAHKAFLAVEGEQSSIRSFVFEDDAAGIRQVETGAGQGAPQVYDLQGRRAGTMKKGVYVVNNKKIWNR